MSRSDMRHWLTLALVGAGLVAVSGGADAYYYARGGYVNSGSVRYGTYGTTAARTTPAAGGSVRYGSMYGGTAARTVTATYDRDYLGRLPGGYRTMPGAGGKTYAYYPRLPGGAQAVTVGGNRYYVRDGVYYKPTTYRGSRVYMAIPPPR